MIRDRTLTMVKGSSHFGVNFRLVIDCLRFLTSNTDFIALGEKGESLVVTPGHDLTSQFMSGKGFILCGNEELKMGFYYRNRRIRD